MHKKLLGTSVDAIKSLMKMLLLILFLTLITTILLRVNYQFNLIEKIVELYKEKIQLYECMLKEKDELIQKLLDKKIITPK